MLRTNLATRPFYNVRAVRVALTAAAVAVLALVLFDVVQLVNLTISQRSLGARAIDAEQLAARLLAEAANTRKQIDPLELRTVADAAREANDIIDRRAFSWTELFERFEATLPSNVRITAVQPGVGREGGMLVTVSVEARRAEDLDEFVEALDAEDAFSEVLATQEQTTADGLIAAVIEATYFSATWELVAEASGPAAPARDEARR
jgi:hypothetical protein